MVGSCRVHDADWLISSVVSSVQRRALPVTYCTLTSHSSGVRVAVNSPAESIAGEWQSPSDAVGQNVIVMPWSLTLDEASSRPSICASTAAVACSCGTNAARATTATAAVATRRITRVPHL